MIHFNKYTEILEEIKKTKGSTEIVAISKNHQMTSVENAIKKGVRIFGENRVIEAKNKFKDLITNYPDIELHLTGPLQSNKVKEASKLFDVFHTLDREKIAIEFNKNLEQIKTKKFFIQVNTGEEKTKSGISPNDVKSFTSYCINDLKINVVGLMCIPPIKDDPSIHFKLLKNLLESIMLKELSIGMSNDYKKALSFNPSYIRLGTILFGSRNETNT